MDETSPPTTQDQFLMDYAGQTMQHSSRVYSNLGQEIIITTEDKIRLCLIEHLSQMEKSHAWVTPLGILLTIVIVFPTTTFQDFLYLSADTWQAMFVICGLICSGWLIKSIYEARVSASIGDVVVNIKQMGLTQEEFQASTKSFE